MKKIKKYISIFLLIFTLSFSTLNVYADNATDLKNKKSEIEKEIEKKEKDISYVKSQKQGVVAQIVEIEESMAAIDGEISKLDTQLADITKKMNEATLELEELELKKNNHYAALKIRMRDMYENSTVSYLDMFLQADSFIDLIDRMYNVRLIMDKDEEIIKELSLIEEQLKEKQAEIEEDKVEVELLLSKQEVKKHAMQTNLDKQQRLMSQLSTSEKSYMNDLNALEAEQQAVEDMINGKTQGDTTVYNGGKFIWPVPGFSRVSSGYGQRDGFYLQDGSWSKPQFHTGIDIPGSYGTKILAAAAGTVITANWVNGYGYTVIINHGSGLTTLYGHNSSLVVKVGDKVYQGQQISKCGSTGYSTGNHCHFEVRLNGKHTNPYNYLPK